MRKVGPYGVDTLPRVLVNTPAVPAPCRGALAERDRLHWRPTDGGDPAALAQEFLAAHGLDLHDLNRPAPTHTGTGVCGAALYLSATAGTLLTGAPTPAASPAPALPDLVVVIYHHTPTPPTPAPPTGPWWLG
ncbi:anthranilate synthase component I family protein, partial [Micromonospora sp. CPCC 205539]